MGHEAGAGNRLFLHVALRPVYPILGRAEIKSQRSTPCASCNRSASCRISSYFTLRQADRSEVLKKSHCFVMSEEDCVIENPRLCSTRRP